MQKDWTPQRLREEAHKHELIAEHYRELAALLEATDCVPVEFDPDDRRDSKSSKKREIYNDLLQHGPSSAKEIKQRTEIPLATIYFVCQDTKLFRKKGHEWSLVKTRKAKEEIETHAVPDAT